MTSFLVVGSIQLTCIVDIISLDQDQGDFLKTCQNLRNLVP
jgi:hypothetical protein